MMKEKLTRRLEALRKELKAGQEMEAELEGRLGQLRVTLLRISGAIQVLEELLAEEPPQPVELESETLIAPNSEVASEY
jgi:hypothetical protein